MKVVIATKNKGKLQEYKKMLGADFEVISSFDVGYYEEVDETGSTFEENSFIKAKALYDYCKIATIADDSGLMVDALNGQPGVFSARYCGEHGDDKGNYTLLLKNMENQVNRKAHFKTALTYIDNETIITVTGETFGEILTKPIGENGFGYDPIFFSYDLKKSFGTATEEEKNKVSHRFVAVQNLLKKLK